MGMLRHLWTEPSTVSLKPFGGEVLVHKRLEIIRPAIKTSQRSFTTLHSDWMNHIKITSMQNPKNTHGTCDQSYKMNSWPQTQWQNLDPRTSDGSRFSDLDAKYLITTLILPLYYHAKWPRTTNVHMQTIAIDDISKSEFFLKFNVSLIYKLIF